MNRKKPIIIRLDAESRPMLPEEHKILEELNPEIAEVEDLDAETIDKYVSVADAVMVIAKPLNRDIIKKMSCCKVISRLGIGTDKIDVEQATQQGILVTNLPGFCTEEVADHTMALLLSVARQVKEFELSMRNGQRPLISTDMKINRLSCSVLGLIGFGRIGKEIAIRARSFGLKIIACDPVLTEEDERGFGVERVELNYLLANSDYVVLICPLTKQTRNMMCMGRFRIMKETAVLINTGRGGLVNEADLADALKKKIIRFAALDVFDNIDVFNPAGFATDHPLFQLDNVIMTPHVAAWSVEMLHEQRLRGARVVVDVLSGKIPQNPVNPEVLHDSMTNIYKKTEK